MLYTKELRTEECQKLLSENNFGRIACALKNQPYLVPFNFAFDGEKYLYAFATLGQKIFWMRENPRVCVELEDIVSQDNWTTLVIFGSYEELTGEGETAKIKDYAHELLSSRPMWWKPAYIAGTLREEVEEKPVYFRILIEKMSGQRVFSENFEEISADEKSVKTPKISPRGLW